MDSSPDPRIPTNLANRLLLFQKLINLPLPQFEHVLFVLDPPAANIPSSQASQADRVKALLDWAVRLGPGLGTVDLVVSSVMNPQDHQRENVPAIIERYRNDDTSFLESSDIRKIEDFLQYSDTNPDTFSKGCYVLRKEKGLRLVFNQIDWIYELAVIADGAKPRRLFPALSPTGKIAPLEWMQAALRKGWTGQYSGRIALALGSFGIFIPEMIKPLQFIFASTQYSYTVRDEALVYLALIGTSEVVPILVDAADTLPAGDDDYLYSRGLFGLLLMDNPNLLAQQILKDLPHSDLEAYAYGLAGSCNPAGMNLLRQLPTRNRPRIKLAVQKALALPWVS